MRARRKEGLTEIPGVGPAIAGKLHALGIRSVKGLKRKDPERLYLKYSAITGQKADRCLLYVFRAAVYYASNDVRDPRLLKWWNWKD